MKRSPIRAVSDRRRQRDAVYPAARRAVADRDGGRCEAAWSPECPGVGAEAHHRAGRGGPDPHRPDNLIWCCAPCHRLIHDRPADARDRGLMVTRIGKPSEAPRKPSWGRETDLPF